MPELPEVETIRRDLTKQVINKKIKKVIIKKSRLVKNPDNFFIKTLVGNKISKIDRIGKLIIFVMKNNLYLLTHLKMTGQLIYIKKKSQTVGGHSFTSDKMDYPNQYTYIIIEFADDSNLYFNDIRTFGYMQIVNERELVVIKERFGIEPLTRNFTISNWEKLFQNRKTNLKALLLNQQLIAGIGNIYADEICFAVKVRPTRKVNKLTNKEIQELFRQTKKIIQQAIAKRGTTFNNYVDTFGRSGNFLKYLQVYGRGQDKCKSCKINIRKIKLAGRGTHFCPHCQK
jgi:formamidopyrimidine-DNA glycosylase